MLEGDDEPNRASGESEQDLRSSDTQENTPEEVEKEKEEENEEKDVEEPEIESSQIQGKVDNDTEGKEEAGKDIQSESKDTDEQQVIQDEKCIEEEKNTKIIEKESQPLVQIDEKEDAKELVEEEEHEKIVEDVIKDNSFEPTKDNVESEQTEVSIKEISTQEIDASGPLVSQENLTESLTQKDVDMAEQRVEEEGQEIESVPTMDQEVEPLSETSLQTVEAGNSTEENMTVEPRDEDKESMVEPEELNQSPVREEVMDYREMPENGSNEKVEEIGDTINEEKCEDQMQIEEVGLPDKLSEALPEDRNEKDADVEMNVEEQNESSHKNKETTDEKCNSSHDLNNMNEEVETPADMDKIEDIQKSNEEEDANTKENHNESPYDELNDSDDSVELKICIEGVTENTAVADDAETEAVVEEENINQEEELSLQCEESMEVEETIEEDGTDDIEGDEVNGIVEDDDINDEEFIPEETTNGSFSDEKTLPECRLKRNYCCVHCGINTQNPRQYLYHLRDDHGENLKVFECSHCVYASKNYQKLLRHARMVHKMKIKKQGTSPSKVQSKGAGISNKTRASVSPGKSSRSSPGKSPKSNDSAQEEWDEMEDEDDQEDEQDGSPSKNEERKFHYCEQCDYSCTSRKLLNRHETSYHLKRRFFRCGKCNYVTHLKGRYTKHLKYHQLPILKCDFCDFRTPYRWNLDRHLKNHNESSGEYRCHLCNFTAQIKQSLTVHISNHHLTSEQIRERASKRTIGISDPADVASDDQEMELLRLERDEHPDALILPGDSAPASPLYYDSSQTQHNGSNSFRVSNIDVSGQDESLLDANDAKDEDGESRKKKPNIKITLKKMRVSKPKDTFFQELNERHNFEEDFIHPDDVVHRNGNVYIKTFKCRFCTFKAAFKNEVARHEKKIHSIPMPKYMGQSKKARKTIKSTKTITSSDDVLAEILQFPKSEEESENVVAAIHQKLNEHKESLSVSKEDDGASKEKDDVELENVTENNEDSMEPVDEQLPDSKDSSPSKDLAKKKGMSFFEKLQEKMPTSNVQNLVCQFCGHESKCLSESVRHQKLHLSAKNIFASASLSTRCQFCRHRCKTTDDLMNHLKLCPEARKNQITDSGRRPSGVPVEENEDSQGSSEKGETAEYDDSEDNMNSMDRTSPVLMDESMMKKEDVNHPMENRVFVWNKFDKTEEQTSQDKDKAGGSKIERRLRRSSTDSLKRKGSGSGSRSPVDMEGSVDYYIESPIPQGIYYYSKKVYRCPQCSFWATTASRFHVHIVGHFNRKPYNCSECGYKSNWRWDITKHIKLKTSRDSSHLNAQVLITDETGEKNYEKYDRYQIVIQLDHNNAHRTEGGIPHKKGKPKRTPDKEDIPNVVTPTASPIRKPPMVTIPVMPHLQPMPRLTRAPAPRSSSSTQPGPMPFGPILPGAQLMVQVAGSAAAGGGSHTPRPPPPLALKGSMKPNVSATTTSSTTKTTTSSGNTAVNSLMSGGQYQIITPQGSVNTSLETLQLLASGSTNLSKLKKQQKSFLEDSEEKDSKATLSHKMRFLAWLNILMTDAQEQVSVSSTGEDGKEVAQMVLDHEGNPEWKCNTCDFRDSEQETVLQHVRLAHTRNGPVSLLHAVHRCDVCGYAAGTKRAVQVHIDSSHGGQGGITSRCEGQNPDTKDSAGDGEASEYSDGPRTYHCRLCPFTCKKRVEMKPHLHYHSERPDCIFKCMFCPYYVPTRSELFEHLRVHGMEVPSSILDAGGKNSSPSPSIQDDSGPKQFVCSACPFETRSRTKLMHHKQFHKPKGLAYRCPHCTYNVTRRHLLSQHIRVHGIEENPEGNGDVNQTDDRSNSPSPSLTITPITNAASGSSGDNRTLTDSSNLPKLTEESTTNMEDIPLVWVSRDHRFFKMFKCRHCPHVNLRKTNIQEHEKMHKTDITKEAGGLHCPYCSYVSVNAGVMSAHLKVHGGSMGQCHAVVDPSLSDEDQLKKLTTRESSSVISHIQVGGDKSLNWKSDEKVLYYCQHCPARFFLEKEIQIHSRFHNTSLPHTCDHCNYGTRQSAHLLTHLKVHTPEYQQRTRSMMAQHRTASNYPPVPGLTIPHELTTDLSGDKGSSKEAGGISLRPFSASPPPSSGVMPQPPPTSKYMCDQCPATFSKSVTLQYHQSLHGAKNPHTCPKCTYAGKTWDSLQQHLQLHTQYDQNCQAEKASNEAGKKPTFDSNLMSKFPQKATEKDSNVSSIPPLKLKLIGLKPGGAESSSDGSRPQFKYYVEEQVPLSGVDLLRRKTQIERGDRHMSDAENMIRYHAASKNKFKDSKEDMEEADPKRIGDPLLHYPLHIDKVTGKSREKRYKCSKCPSAFEKVEQYTVHTNLHDSNHKYRCRICDYSVKFYANFMMHIKRHKYHERMVAQTSGKPPPVENDLKYEPIISKENSQGEKFVRTTTEDHGNKENLEEADLTTIERQHLLLQNKKGGVEGAKKDEERERRVYYCQYCPYANVRRDAVDSHSMRHRANGGFGCYKCTFCDYTASQPNFIREHTKVHFRPFKYVHPEGFMRHDRQEITSTPIGTGIKVSSKLKKDDNSLPVKEKYTVFSREVETNLPQESDGEEEENVDSEMVKSIQVNFCSGDIVEAPLDYVISLRPKPKVTSTPSDTNDITTAPNSTVVPEKMEGVISEASTSNGEATSYQVTSQSLEEKEGEEEKMEVDENSTSVEGDKTIEKIPEEVTDEASTNSEDKSNAMEVDNQTESDSAQNGNFEENSKENTNSPLVNEEHVNNSESKLVEMTQSHTKSKESIQHES